MEDAFFYEFGVYLTSFLLEGEVLGQTKFQVVLQAPPTRLPQEVEDGLRKSNVAWIGVEFEGGDVTVPAWFVYQNGKVYVLSSKEPSLEEQSIPGLPGARDLVVITPAQVPGHRPGALARRRPAPGGTGVGAGRGSPGGPPPRPARPPEAAVRRWRDTWLIAELTPIVPA